MFEDLVEVWNTPFSEICSTPLKTETLYGNKTFRNIIGYTKQGYVERKKNVKDLKNKNKHVKNSWLRHRKKQKNH